MQLITMAGEMTTGAVLAIGAATVAGWIVAGFDHRAIVAQPQPGEVWHCWLDRRYGEMCAPASRLPLPRRYFARDVARRLD